MKIYLAPLQGITDDIFRRYFCIIYGGIDQYFTPFYRLEKGHIPHLQQLKPAREEPLTTPQILPLNLEEARQLCTPLHQLGYRKIDINLGCPFPKVVNTCRGAGMLPFPDKVNEVLQITRMFPDVSFSVKLRSGKKTAEELWALVPILNSYPLHHITLHPRTVLDGYSNPPDMDLLPRFLQESTHPVIYNGDILDIDTIWQIQKTYPQLQGVMIGRGLIDRPGMLHTAWTDSEQRQKLSEFYHALYHSYCLRLSGESQILAKMQSLWQHFQLSAPPKLRKKILKTRSLAAYESYVSQLIEPRDTI